MSKFLTSVFKLFGKKSDSDIKDLMPLVDQIHEAYELITNLSNDDLGQRRLN